MHSRYREDRLLVGVYVDDLIITGCSGIDKFKEEMELFNMSDVGLLTFYLGLGVQQTGEGIKIGQSAYAAKLIERSGLSGCNACKAPMESRLRLSKESESPPVDATEYKR